MIQLVLTLVSEKLQDDDLSKNDLMGRVSIDVAELAMAKGRRLQQWFPIHFVPQVITFCVVLRAQL